MEQAGKVPGNWNNVLKLIVPYFLIVGAFQLIAILLMGLQIADMRRDLNPEQTLILMVFNCCGTVLVIWLFRKYVDRRPFLELGLLKISVPDLLYGIGIGFLIMLSGFMILLAAQQIAYLNYSFDLKDFTLSFWFFVLVAFTEELLIRGYILNNLMGTMNKYLALLVTSVLFCLMHLANANYNWFEALELFIAGILLGLSYIYTRNLCFSMALHFSWNFFQGTVFGFNVSGKHTYAVINQLRYEDNLWNGGAFGFEGSVLSLPLQGLAIIVIYMMFHRRKADSL